MKTIKMLFVILFAAAMVFMMYLLVGKKPEPTIDGFYTYSVINGKATVKSCDTSLSGDVTIPDTLGGYPVTSIGGYAFDGCSDITSLTIPESVCEIQMYAFENCSNLTAIYIPHSVTIIDGDAFNNCRNLTGIWVDSANETYSSDSFGVLYNKAQTTLIRAPMNLPDPYNIPASVQNIGERAFFGCKNLKKIIIPDGVNSIDWYTFSNCTNLATIVIPSSMTSIGYEVFRGCNSLRFVCFKGSEDAWNALIIKSGNNLLTSAHITYDFCEHIWDSGVITKVATCKEPGIRTFACTLCGDTEMKALPKLNEHSWDKGKTTKPATCKEEGVKTYTCTVCKTTQTESTPMLTTHTWHNGVTTKEPTCKETGIMTYTCRMCGVTKTEVIEMLDTHTPGEPATGTTDQTCTVCGKVLVPATGETEPTDPEPTEPDDNTGTGGFFGPIIDFFNSIGAFFENLFASIMALFGL